MLSALQAALLAPPVPAQSASAPIAAVALDATAGTDELYTVDLAAGTVAHGDQLRRDPLSIRLQRIPQNVFQDIGRPRDQVAASNEMLFAPIHTSAGNARAVLLVETSTGFVAFYDQLGKNGTFGRITTAIGRPFAPLAAADGNFALLMRHDDNGRSVGAYLYHAGSGRAFYLDGVDQLEIDAAGAAASGFPRLGGRVCAAEILSSERTTGYLAADAADGSLRILELGVPLRATVRDLSLHLFPTFATDLPYPPPQRFVATPIQNSGENTTHVLFVDVATGDLASLALGDDRSAATLVKLEANLYAVLGTAADAGQRVIAAVPRRAGNGSTGGIWLIDSLTRAIAYVDQAETPGSATVRRVTAN